MRTNTGFEMTASRLAAALMLVGGLFFSTAAAQTMPIEELRAERQRAAHRERRVIFNNDGNEPVYLCENNTPGELLRHRTADIAGTHVDSIFYCTWSSGFGMFTHGTEVGSVFDTQEALFSKNRITEMLAAGTDPLEVVADFGKRNDIEVFWSFRMNDTHDASSAEYGPIMFRANALKQKHPEWLIGTPENRPKFGGWTAVDFGRPEIRDLATRYVEEVCRNYDVDGIELDFFRHPVFFKRAAQTGTPCTDQERALMTQMMRQIRKVTETEGRKRGRPILVAVRVPDSVDYSRDVGLDIEHWLAEDLVDLMVVSGYFRLNPWRTSVELGREHGVPVYPSFDESRVRDPESKKLRTTAAAYRGRTLAARHAGADGVYLFNAFNPKDPIWNELGAPAKLLTLDHDYFASIRGEGRAAGGALPHREYQNVPTLNPASPKRLRPGDAAEVEFQSGSDFAEADAGSTPRVTLRLRFDELTSEEAIAVTLNGTPLGSPRAVGDWLGFSVQPGQLQLADNVVRVTLSAGAPPATWTDLHCTVRWPGERTRTSP